MPAPTSRFCLLPAVSAFFVVGSFAVPAAADSCEIVERQAAEQAVELVRDAGEVIVSDWARPIKVRDVLWSDGSVRVNGGLTLDLAHAYIRGKPDEYQNLGWLVGCGSKEVAKTVPRSAFAPARADDQMGSRPTLIGLVEIPTLFEWIWLNRRRSPRDPPVPVRAGPSPVAQVVRSVRDGKEIQSKEFNYEMLGAVVLERHGFWFRIQLEDGKTAWVGPDHAGPFHRLDELVVDRLAYLGPRWDGFIFEHADRSSPARQMSGVWRKHMREQVPIEAKSAQWIDGYLWVRVEVLSDSVCGEADPIPLAAGWVPAHDVSGEPAVWYYSRGC